MLSGEQHNQRWTSAPPTQPGYYWHRWDRGEVRMTRVIENGGGPLVYYTFGDIDQHQGVTTGGDWCGPIPVPAVPLPGG